MERPDSGGPRDQEPTDLSSIEAPVAVGEDESGEEEEERDRLVKGIGGKDRRNAEVADEMADDDQDGRNETQGCQGTELRKVGGCHGGPGSRLTDLLSEHFCSFLIPGPWMLSVRSGTHIARHHDAFVRPHLLVRLSCRRGHDFRPGKPDGVHQPQQSFQAGDREMLPQVGFAVAGSQLRRLVDEGENALDRLGGARRAPVDGPGQVGGDFIFDPAHATGQAARRPQGSDRGFQVVKQPEHQDDVEAVEASRVEHLNLLDLKFQVTVSEEGKDQVGMADVFLAGIDPQDPGTTLRGQLVGKIPFVTGQVNRGNPMDLHRLLILVESPPIGWSGPVAFGGGLWLSSTNSWIHSLAGKRALKSAPPSSSAYRLVGAQKRVLILGECAGTMRQALLASRCQVVVRREAGPTIYRTEGELDSSAGAGEQVNVVVSLGPALEEDAPKAIAHLQH